MKISSIYRLNKKCNAFNERTKKITSSVRSENIDQFYQDKTKTKFYYDNALNWTDYIDIIKKENHEVITNE